MQCSGRRGGKCRLIRENLKRFILTRLILIFDLGQSFFSNVLMISLKIEGSYNRFILYRIRISTYFEAKLFELTVSNRYGILEKKLGLMVNGAMM